MTCCAFAVFALEAVLFQWTSGAYSSDFSAATSDESAHFVTALMVREFLAGGSWLHPVAFAKAYYLHYPKVAIGHWPPLLYALLGPWQLAFGSSRAVALAFVAAISATTATTIFVAGRRLMSAPLAFLAAVLFLALPLTREAGGEVMAELLVTLSLLVAALCCARSVRTDSRRAWLGFGIAAAGATLASGSGWAIGIVPPLVLLITNRLDLLRSPRLWLAAVVAIGLSAPWYLGTQHIRAAEGAFVGGGATFVAQALVVFPSAVVDALGPVLCLLAVLGLATTGFRAGDGRAALAAAMVALPIAKVGLHVAIPAGLETRYVLGALPGLLLFAGRGIDWCGTRVRRGRAGPVRWGLAVAALFSVALAGMSRPASTMVGYTAAARGSSLEDPSPQVTLLASDSRGEGAWIAAVASSRPRPRDFVLRGSKVFVNEDWLGRHSTDRFASAADTRRLLDASPITTVVIDHTTEAAERRPYHDRLAGVVAADAAWRRVGVFPLVRFGAAVSAGLEVFARIGPAPSPPDAAQLAALGMRADMR